MMVENVKKRNQDLNRQQSTGEHRFQTLRNSSLKLGLSPSKKKLFSPQAFSKYLNDTKNQRAMKQFSQTQKGWKKHINLVKQKTNRAEQDQLLNRGELQRKIKQELEYIEIIKPYVEKYGARHWEYGLRSDEHSMEGEMRMHPIGPPMSHLHCYEFQKGQNYLPEVIRKPAWTEEKKTPKMQTPKISQVQNILKQGVSKKGSEKSIARKNSAQAIMSGLKAQKTRLDNKYFKDKLKNGQYKKFQEAYMKDKARIEENIDHLKVMGKNKMDMEIASFQKQMEGSKDFESSSQKQHYVLHFFAENE